MAQNISKYVQLTDFILLEYEFNRNEVQTPLVTNNVYPHIATTESGFKQYYTIGGIASVNTDLQLQSVSTTPKRSKWYVHTEDTSGYIDFFSSDVSILQPSYPHDIVKVHIVSGYNFEDVAGFLLQVRAESSTGELVDMCDFTWVKQIQGNSVLKFSAEPLYLGNRFYDKYLEFKIPSIGILGGKITEPIENELQIKQLSDVYIQYSTITDIANYNYFISEKIETQLPVQSNADNFNCFISESTSGDYIEYYATWNYIIIGEYIGDIESGRIPLFTSNNPNDNYQKFNEEYGNTSKWVVIHELQVYEHIPPTTMLMTQRFQFTQEGNFMNPNMFRPVIINSDIASSYSIDYICRLMNRMDGSQIIRKASFSSTNPKKYGRIFSRINVDNYIPYKVFNKIPAEVPNILVNNAQQTPKYVKIFYDTTNVTLNVENEVYVQGTGPLFLKDGDSVYKFKFEKLNSTNERENIDLSGVYTYALSFTLDDSNIIKTYALNDINMNPTLGELTFKLNESDINTILKQSNNTYYIVIENPDSTKYTFYQGLYYPYKERTNIRTIANSRKSITGKIEG